MATKRGFCPNCNLKNRSHYFDVNPDAKIVYCPCCMKQLNPEEAIKAYDKHVDSLLRFADFTLYEIGNPEQAYSAYAEILEFDSSNTLAFLGRLMCLLYMSKIRKSYIKDVAVMLEVEEDQYHKKEESAKYVQALMKMSNVVDLYRHILEKKLTLKSYFYDEDCLRLYLKHFNDINHFKETLLSEAKYIARRFDEQKAELLVNMLEIQIEEQTRLMNDSEYILVNGDHYKFDHMKRNGEVEITKLENKHTSTKLTRYRLASLENKQNYRYIKDIAFRNYTKVIFARKVAVWVLLIGFLLAAGAGVASYFFFGTDYIFYPIIAGGVVLFGLAIAFSILFVKWSRQLKHKKENAI